MRIGKRFNIKCSKLLLDGVELPFVDEINYLGISKEMASILTGLFVLLKPHFIDASMPFIARHLLHVKMC